MKASSRRKRANRRHKREMEMRRLEGLPPDIPSAAYRSRAARRGLRRGYSRGLVSVQEMLRAGFDSDEMSEILLRRLERLQRIRESRDLPPVDVDVIKLGQYQRDPLLRRSDFSTFQDRPRLMDF